MGAVGIAVLGGIAGFTIFLGLPIGRMRAPSVGLRAFLNATATGILLFLLWDVLTHAIEPVETALTAVAVEHTGSWARFTGLSTVFAAGLVIGLLSLVYYERWMRERDRAQAARPFGPGAMAIDEPTIGRLDLTSRPDDWRC